VVEMPVRDGDRIDLRPQAIQEDADAVGVSILSGADDVVVVVGGTIPQDDADELKALGVAAVFGPGATTGEIVDFLRGAVAV
jgi:methylmalonyl-CoA mutase C-terminal domain/subunit